MTCVKGSYVISRLQPVLLRVLCLADGWDSRCEANYANKKIIIVTKFGRARAVDGQAVCLAGKQEFWGWKVERIYVRLLIRLLIITTYTTWPKTHYYKEHCSPIDLHYPDVQNSQNNLPVVLEYHVQLGSFQNTNDSCHIDEL